MVILKGMLYIILSFLVIYAVIMFILWIICLNKWFIYKPINNVNHYKEYKEKNISNIDDTL